MSVQPSLFDVTDPEPLPRPKKQRPGTGPIKYSPYSVKTRTLCQDCAQLNYEYLMEGRLDAPQPRQVRFKRTQAGVETLLCAAHKADRELQEARATAGKAS